MPPVMSTSRLVDDTQEGASTSCDATYGDVAARSAASPLLPPSERPHARAARAYLRARRSARHVLWALPSRIHVSPVHCAGSRRCRVARREHGASDRALRLLLRLRQVRSRCGWVVRAADDARLARDYVRRLPCRVAATPATWACRPDSRAVPAASTSTQAHWRTWRTCSRRSTRRTARRARSGRWCPSTWRETATACITPCHAR